MSKTKKTVKGMRKIGVGIIGFPLIVLGIILIPLPGPGLLVVFAGLFLLSTEFDWANKYVQIVREKLGGIYKIAKERAEKIEQKSDKKIK